jgi:hypothetical protein
VRAREGKMKPEYLGNERLQLELEVGMWRPPSPRMVVLQLPQVSVLLRIADPSVRPG